MDATFAGLTFQMMTTPHTREQGADAPVRHIPGGNISYIDLAGLAAETLSFGVYCPTFADYTAMKALVGQSGTLAYIDETLTITLIKFRIVKRYISGPIEASADFVGA